MHLRHLPNVLGDIGPMPRQQLLIHDRQAVLIALRRNLAVERLRRRVERRDAAENPGGVRLVERLDEPEIGHFHVIADHEQIARLDVEMLKIMLLEHEIEPPRRRRASNGSGPRPGCRSCRR